jgi:hypothetical protein
MGFLSPDHLRTTRLCHFLHAQKVTKKGTCANASPRKANANLAGQRGHRTYTTTRDWSGLGSLCNKLARASHFALNIENQDFAFATPHSSRYE